MLSKPGSKPPKVEATRKATTSAGWSLIPLSMKRHESRMSLVHFNSGLCMIQRPINSSAFGSRSFLFSRLIVGSLFRLFGFLRFAGFLYGFVEFHQFAVESSFYRIAFLESPLQDLLGKRIFKQALN